MPVRAPRGRRVHATSLLLANETACGKKYSGWTIVPRIANCKDCKLAMGKDCRAKRRRRRR